jgi:hypothetical protein
MAPKSKSLKVNILGVEWEIHAVSTAAYKRRHGSDSHAITYTKDREIYFNKDTLAPNYVRHELFHAYIASTNVNSSFLSNEQFEEVCAEIFGDRALDVITHADQILNFFLR